MTDYSAALLTADRQDRRLAILFHPPGLDLSQRLFDEAASAKASGGLRRAVLARFAVDAKATTSEGEVELLAHPAFAALHRRPGLAVLDYSTTDPGRRGRVSATVPLEPDGRCDPALLAEALGEPVPELPWQTDYLAAADEAKREGRMMLVFFCGPGCELSERFDRQTLRNAEIRRQLAALTLVRVPLDVRVPSEGYEGRLLDHPAFAEMLGLAGLAMIDYAHRDAGYYGHVVSVFPFFAGRVYGLDEMKVILGLPPGTLTQRTLVYAVRTHPEGPASAESRADSNLMTEAQSHSELQARIGRQGHHAWDQRFHRINALLPGGCLASEVCAESWPGQNLLESAVECVRCWRLSSGHWRSVSSPNQAFGYDMKRGANGIWYATGIFGR